MKKRPTINRSICSILVLLIAAVQAGQVMAAALTEEEIQALESSLIERPHHSQRQELFRQYALEMLINRTPQRGLQTLARFFQEEFSSGSHQLNSRNRRLIYSRAADAYQLLRMAYASHPRLEVPEQAARWLLNSDTNLGELLDAVSPADDFVNCWQIIATLHDHDPRDREHFRRLIIAMSVVWDQPRPPLHYQMGGQKLPYAPEITKRYDYFKNLYARGDAQMRYRDLSTAALTFVVDTPVPVAELEWARDNVRGHIRSWDSKFTDIEYDHGRLAREQYQWPHGSYTLETIAKHGGICVEQGYYAVITARAHGIPALFFVGQGRRGPHAWMGYMQPRGRWVLDVGRYERDRYATGHAVDPQTNQPMTDHYLNYMRDRAANPSRYQAAAAYTRLALTLAELGFTEMATDAAGRSVAQLPIYELPWLIQETILRQQEDMEELMKMLDNKANRFGDYPDFVANIRQKQARILADAGYDNRARQFLQRHKSLVSRHRDDLQSLLANEQIRLAYEDGDYREARRLYERLLRDQASEGSKMLWILESYLEFTQQTEQQSEAAAFLRRHITSLTRGPAMGRQDQQVLLQFLARAYRNAGMTDEAIRIERDLN